MAAVADAGPRARGVADVLRSTGSFLSFPATYTSLSLSLSLSLELVGSVATRDAVPLRERVGETLAFGRRRGLSLGLDIESRAPLSVSCPVPDRDALESSQVSGLNLGRSTVFGNPTKDRS